MNWLLENESEEEWRVSEDNNSGRVGERKRSEKKWEWEKRE